MNKEGGARVCEREREEREWWALIEIEGIRWANERNRTKKERRREWEQDQMEEMKKYGKLLRTKTNTCNFEEMILLEEEFHFYKDEGFHKILYMHLGREKKGLELIGFWKGGIYYTVAIGRHCLCLGA